jgi:hypothetical protein
MTDQERMRHLRKHHYTLAVALDQVAIDLIEYKDNHVHGGVGTDRECIRQLARFLEGDACKPFPKEK